MYSDRFEDEELRELAGLLGKVKGDAARAAAHHAFELARVGMISLTEAKERIQAAQER